MSLSRRGFLGGLAGILAAGAAPAIIHNAMKIVVPKEGTLVWGARSMVDPTHAHKHQVGLGNVDNYAGSFNRAGPTQLGGEATKWMDRPLTYNLEAARQDQFGEFFFPTVVFNTLEAERNFTAFFKKHHAQAQRQVGARLRRFA